MNTGEERDLIEALGMSSMDEDAAAASPDKAATAAAEDSYKVVPNPDSEAVDLSELRGVIKAEDKLDNDSDTELEGLAELVPDIKARRRQSTDDMAMNTDSHIPVGLAAAEGNDGAVEMNLMDHDAPPGEEEDQLGELLKQSEPQNRKMSMASATESTAARRLSMQSATEPTLHADSKRVHPKSKEEESNHVGGGGDSERDDYQAEDEASSHEQLDDDSFDEFPGSDTALDNVRVDPDKVPKEFINMSSGQSVSTATQTQEVRMPMYLPTFKPATGCTNASDFIVRCFVARLRSGITVVKHGRSRWCKSRLRVLQIHPDGRSLSWKPAEGEPTSSKRPPKLDLSTCLEVRHAWSPDPQNPMYTGTSILRQKCEAANAHKSFALIFKQRTVDITAVTADQCKVLMEGFSALCFRLQVANLAKHGAKKPGMARPMPEDDGVSVTASATLTNTSTPRAR
jgi:hypothetical protein